jgi:hypothetical protein
VTKLEESSAAEVEKEPENLLKQVRKNLMCVLSLGAFGQSGNPSGKHKVDRGETTLSLADEFRAHERKRGVRAIEKLYEENPNACLRQ